jgi:hypothetical protein
MKKILRILGFMMFVSAIAVLVAYVLFGYNIGQNRGFFAFVLAMAGLLTLLASWE